MNRRHITREEAGILILMLAVLLGGFARLYAPSTAEFPLNDGGLFLVMMEALQDNGFSLPSIIEFNGLTIPFAYPPLGFYVGAWISQTFAIDLVSILQWLPAVVTVFAIPAFFWLAYSILGSKFQAGLAAFMYALTPRASNWGIMGGGLTRSLGLLFLILTAASVLQLFRTQEKKYLPPSIFFGALTILSHPEAAIHAASICFVLFLFYGRSKTGIIHTGLVVAGIILLTSIWWIPVLTRFGIDPYLTASQTGFHSLFLLILPFFSPLTDEPHLSFIAVFGLIGLAYSISRRNYLIPIIYVLPYLVEPRNAPVIAMIPLAMLATTTLTEIIIPAMTNHQPGEMRLTQVFLLFLGVIMFGSAVNYSIQFSKTAISKADRNAFEWVKTNLPQDSRVLVLTGEVDTFCDGVSEWFPALTGQVSPTTVQGREWLPGFASAMNVQREIQTCIKTDQSLSCVEEIAKESGIDYDYLYISRKPILKDNCRGILPITVGSTIVSDLASRPEYVQIYQTDEVLIYARERTSP